MKLVTKIVILACVALLIVSSAAFAQEMETETFEDEDGFFTIEYPAVMLALPDQFSESEDALPFPSYAFTSSLEAAELSMAFEPVPEGEWGIGLIFLPKAMFAEMGLAEDASITDIAEIFVMGQFAEGDENLSEEQMAEMMEMMAVEEIELNEETEAAQVDLPGETEDNLVLFYEPTEEVVVLLSLLTSPGGRTDEQIEAWLAMANSLELSATADEFFADMMMSEE